ncbi:MAG: type I-E CRISPR-associated protein Cas5/CasD [Anaerolineaceae bacterium]|nr:type I-E CRISPR-associated protein Cas5/CasD [Anaerolineaceae bacterium]
MATLLLRIEAPMQSWGVSSLFTERDTAREPSKSGVIGLICAALGRSRTADLTDLSVLRMGVRVDREGSVEKDFQTAREIMKADGSKPKKGETVTSERYYLADAVFLVGLEGPPELLQQIQKAFKNPIWALFFGRKAFPPSKPVFLEDGLRKGELISELCGYPLLRGRGVKNCRLVLESEEGEFRRQDNPINFAERKFKSRMIQIQISPCGRKEEA